MTDDQKEVLQTVQEVLRLLVLALAAETRCDMPRLAALLTGLSQSPVGPAARTMIEDLALGLTAVSPHHTPRQ